MAELFFYVLGPVMVGPPASPASPGGPTTRAVLCSLLTSAGRAVPGARLMYDVWGDDAPGEHALQSHISRLRSRIGRNRIESLEGSYRLAADATEIDARRFEALVAEAAEAIDPQIVRGRCLQAFDLWRGVPFSDLADRAFLQLEVGRLEDVRLHAIEMCVEADLALGRHREIIGSLRAAVAEFPLHERMWAFLIRALDEAGRQPEAITAYEEIEGLLEAELGIRPNRELQELRGELTAA